VGGAEGVPGRPRQTRVHRHEAAREAEEAPV